MDGEGVRGTLNRVVKGVYQMPRGLSLEAQDIISRLLQKVRENPHTLRHLGNSPPWYLLAVHMLD